MSENIFISSDYDADLFPHRKKHFFFALHQSCRAWANDKLLLSLYTVGKDAVQYRSAFFITALTASECCCRNPAAIFRAASSALSPVSFSILFAVFIESAGVNVILLQIFDFLQDISFDRSGTPALKRRKYALKMQ
ncbi:MAG: hypothetical protein IJE66_03980 [Akkermansia sp.]|nr:hypothetical protein [Akkermansia sp.]